MAASSTRLAPIRCMTPGIRPSYPPTCNAHARSTYHLVVVTTRIYCAWTIPNACPHAGHRRGQANSRYASHPPATPSSCHEGDMCGNAGDATGEDTILHTSIGTSRDTAVWMTKWSMAQCRFERYGYYRIRLWSNVRERYRMIERASRPNAHADQRSRTLMTYLWATTDDVTDTEHTKNVKQKRSASIWRT